MSFQLLLLLLFLFVCLFLFLLNLKFWIVFVGFFFSSFLTILSCLKCPWASQNHKYISQVLYKVYSKANCPHFINAYTIIVVKLKHLKCHKNLFYQTYYAYVLISMFESTSQIKFLVKDPQAKYSNIFHILLKKYMKKISIHKILLKYQIYHLELCVPICIMFKVYKGHYHVQGSVISIDDFCWYHWVILVWNSSHLQLLCINHTSRYFK